MCQSKIDTSEIRKALKVLVLAIVGEMVTVFGFLKKTKSHSVEM
jgi:hypothetical protein